MKINEKALNKISEEFFTLLPTYMYMTSIMIKGKPTIETNIFTDILVPQLDLIAFSNELAYQYIILQPQSYGHCLGTNPLPSFSKQIKCLNKFHHRPKHL